MFSGEESITFETAKSAEEIVAELDDALSELGRVTISKRGGITIEPKSKFSTTFADSVIEGNLQKSKKNPKQFSLNLTYKVSPTILCWVVAVIGTTSICIGFLVILIPFNLKGKLQKDVLEILARIEDSVT